MKIVIILLFCSIQSVFSGFERNQYGARNSALGMATLAVVCDVWAVRSNPAGVAFISSLALGVDYAPAPYGLGELKTITAALAIPSTIGNFGVAAHAFGFSLYREVSAALAWAARVEGVGVGVRVNLHSVSIARYGHAGAFSIDAGVVVPLLPSLIVGLALNNPGGSTIGASREKLPQVFSLGASFSPLKDAAIFGAYSKEPGFDASTQFGVEFTFLNHAMLRAGIDGAPALLCGGVGVRWSGIYLDYSLSHHDDLGWTQEISVNLEWGGGHE